MIDTRLRVFRSVASNLSFTKASQELFISQPAITKHVQELEREYNVRLFDRMGNRIRLTRAGQVMLDHAGRILKGYEQLEISMNALHANAKGELRIGASTTISQYVLPEIIAHFRKCYPDIRISMLSGNSRGIEAALAGGSIDLGMVEGPARQPHLKYTPFMEDELVAVVSTRGRLARREHITLEELKRVPVVLREFGSGTLDVIRQSLRKKGVRLSSLNIEMNIGTTEGIKHYVEHSDCMGIVSVRSVSKELLANIFKIVEVDTLKTERQFCFVEKRGDPSELHQMFKCFITKNYKG